MFLNTIWRWFVSFFQVVFYLLGYIFQKIWIKTRKYMKICIITSCIIALILFTYNIMWSISTITKFNKEKFISHTHYIYDRTGEILGYTSPTLAAFTKIEDFPIKLINSVLAIEDRGFYNHCGLSFTGILRSIIFYIPDKFFLGYRPRGGSTITQQLMRQLFLNDSLSFYRKFKEIILSVVATQKISKKDILEVYMNQAYFSNNIHGFKMAADVFWGKKLSELEADEIAILVSMLKGPEYSPAKNIDKLMARRNTVLKIMLTDKIITQDEFDNAISKPIDFSIERFNHVNFNSLEVKNYIINNFGEAAYNQGGLKVYTTIDLNKQKAAESALQEICLALERDCAWRGPVGKSITGNLIDLGQFIHLCGKLYMPVIMSSSDGSFVGPRIKGKLRLQDIEKYHKFKSIDKGDIVIISKNGHLLMNLPSYNGQITIIKNGYNAGDVLASVGGIDLFLLRDDITKIPREVGSTMKILNTLIALEELKISTSFALMDGKAVVKKNELKYVDDETFAKYMSKYYDNNNKKTWPVRNWDLKNWGELTLLSSFEHSRNIPFCYLVLNKIGINKFREYLINLKIIKNSDTIYPSTCLGCVAVPPREFAGIVCGLIQYGNRLETNFIREIYNNKDEIIHKTTTTKPNRMFSEKSIYALLSCMKGTAIRGTGKSLNGVMTHIYAKTGVTSNNRDAICLAVNKDILVLVTICKNNAEPLGPNIWGAVYAILCARKVFTKLKSELNDQSMMSVIPPGVKINKMKYNKFGSSCITIEDETDEVIIE